MVKKFSYTQYVLGVFIVWVIVLTVSSKLMSTDKFHGVLIFGTGFLLGVLAASIARKVYK